MPDFRVRNGVFEEKLNNHISRADYPQKRDKRRYFAHKFSFRRAEKAADWHKRRAKNAKVDYVEAFKPVFDGYCPLFNFNFQIFHNCPSVKIYFISY